MKIFDLHQDLLLYMRSREHYDQAEQTSWAMLEDSQVDLVCATAFPDPLSADQTDPAVNELITEDIEQYRDYVARCSTEWRFVMNATDLARRERKLLMHIEGLNVWSGTPNDWQMLEKWYELGLRSLGPWWNIDNALGGGTNSPERGLTNLGRELITWIEERPLVLDLAHASRQTFADIAAITTRPLYVSHGNADTLCPSPRNYTDKQIRQIAESDGVIGIFFSQMFTTGPAPGTVQDTVRHITYLRDLIGIRHIALGSDFGGIVSGTLAGLASVADFPAVIEVLIQADYSTTDIEAITRQNAERILRAHLSS